MSYHGEIDPRETIERVESLLLAQTALEELDEKYVRSGNYEEASKCYAAHMHLEDMIEEETGGKRKLRLVRELTEEFLQDPEYALLSREVAQEMEAELVDECEGATEPR